MARGSRSRQSSGGSSRGTRGEGSVESRSGRAPRRATRAANDALSLLAQDHRTVEKLFKRLPTDPTAFDELQEELDVHARLEEEIFYPAVEQALTGQGVEMAVEARQQHQEVRELLAEMSGLDRESEEFEEKLRKLQDSVEHHVEDEEGEMFPRARKAIAQEQLVQMGSLLKDTKERLKSVRAQS